MNGTHKVLAYSDDTNLIGDDIRIETNADLLLNACKDVCLAVNTIFYTYILAKQQTAQKNTIFTLYFIQIYCYPKYPHLH